MNATGPATVPGGANLLAPGTRFAGLRVERVLSRGSSGELYVAVDATTQRPCALKVLAADPDAPSGATAVTREAAALRRLQHPSIVEVLATGTEGGRSFVAMALLPGTDLRRYTRSSRLLPEALVLRLGADVADALAHAHAQGVVHRDLKPANLMFDAATQRVWVTDFGVARLADAAATRTGVMLGTPSFMPPEQLGGAAASAAGDVYALGVTLFQLLTGALPYEGATMGALLHAMAQGSTRTLADLRPDLPPALDALLAAMLSRDADQRPVAAEVARRLAALAAPPR